MANVTDRPDPVPRVALVTGASSGIGRAVALRLLAEGWVVYGGARRPERMADLIERGGRALALDVTDSSSMEAALTVIDREQHRLDALVNNAGVGVYGALEELPIDQARRQFEVNVFGLMELTQRVLPGMRERGAGRIVNVGSMAGRIWMPVGGWYHASKYALEALSDALRMETRPFGIHVSLIQPGVIRSEWADIAQSNLAQGNDDSPYASIKRQVLGALKDRRFAGQPDQVADVVAKALSARRPRRRYAVPLDAKLFIFLHWLLPTFVYEAVLKAMLARYDRRR
ncbi:oxidoreductase [Halomonas sp. V046]|uniref:oxidoreductase n=1 Tax=Halomonas sp. V046 TaxID=3459611 RepID=UPI004043C289